MARREDTWGYDQQDPWLGYYCPVCREEVDPRMGSVVWYVRLVDHNGAARMTHRWCFPSLELVLGRGPTYRKVQPPPTIIDRQRFIPGMFE